MAEEQHFQSSAIVRDFVLGASDGLTVPFALAAGLSGAVDSPTIIITAGLAEIAAGSIAMGLGGYLAGRTEMNTTTPKSDVNTKKFKPYTRLRSARPRKSSPSMALTMNCRRKWRVKWRRNRNNGSTL